MRRAGQAGQVEEAAAPRRTVARVLQLLEGDGGGGGGGDEGGEGRAYRVLWARQSSRKRKTWEGDGQLLERAGSWRLAGEGGTALGSARVQPGPALEPGARLRIGNKEVEIVEECSVSVVTSQPLMTEQLIPSNSKKPRIGQSAFRGGHSIKPLVFPRPASKHQWSHNARKLTVRDVTLDSILSRALRPHQKDGVVFLYECVMGFRNPDYFGAILADEMGLGKTLQSVALIWTLLKQGPYGTAVCRRVLIITPSSLCANWKKEFTKWLGQERIQTYVVDKSHPTSAFTYQPLVPIMIISYEQFVRNFESIHGFNFDMIVCDEGQRLKNSSVKAAQLLCKLECKRRVLLTGTPVQNDLEEYFAVINVVNPGILGTYADFRKTYELPIVAAQQPNCDESVQLLAENRSAELNRLISKFILRRTSDIMENYLPSKKELILCCSLSRIQKDLYENVIDEWFNTETKNPFATIATLRKICNHPFLLEEPKEYASEEFAQSSGKFSVINSILENVVIEKNENLVLVSYSTRFLDLLQVLCEARRLNCLRLDGSTPVPQRKALVDAFNNHAAKIFLLSARAGGMGLNLTGATRLVLLDGDWNPSNDLQALARIWRDGQKRGVKIYRLISTGTIEEKILQRQLSKLSLSNNVDDPENVKSSLKFSEDELKDLFTPDFVTHSTTHDVLQCTCLEELPSKLGDGHCVSKIDSNSSEVNQLKDWKHFRQPFGEELLQDIGLTGNTSIVTFIFQKITNESSTG